MNKNKGFTLIELLVVIAIIGVLAAVILASLNSARAKARDAKRIKDIQEIRKAIDLYVDDNGNAPDMGYSNCLDSEGWLVECKANETNYLGNWNTLESQLSPYISKLSKDPCGARCYDRNGNYKYYGYFTYVYEAPAALTYLNDAIGPGTNSNLNYRIFAQNLESNNPKSFGFGLGSF